MHWIYQITILFVCLTSTSLHGESGYLFCLDGGGSKTLLQVMNPKGEIVSLIKEGIQRDRIETTGSNINLIGLEGVRQVLRALFENVYVIVENREMDLSSLISECRLVAGMAGAGLPQNKQLLISLFQERGIRSDRILVMSDAEMALQLIPREGIILIAGTGSICLGKRERSISRRGFG